MGILLQLLDVLLNITFWHGLLVALVIIYTVKTIRKNSSDYIMGQLISLPFKIIGITIALILVVNIAARNPLRLYPRMHTNHIPSLTTAQLAPDNILNAIREMHESNYFFHIQMLDNNNRYIARHAAMWDIGNRYYLFGDMQSLHIGIYMHRQGQARENIARNPSARGRRGRLITNDNNTAIWQQRPAMSTAASGLHFPNNNRTIRTEVQLGDVTIILRESRRWYAVHRSFSNEFLTALVGRI